MSDDNIDPLEVLQAILNSLTPQLESKDDLIKFWFYIGRMMGIEDIFPEMQVVVTPDEEGVNQPVLLVGTLIPHVVDILTSEKVLTEQLAQWCLEEIKDIDLKKVYH
jgi:hypothetical protein